MGGRKGKTTLTILVFTKKFVLPPPPGERGGGGGGEGRYFGEGGGLGGVPPPPTPSCKPLNPTQAVMCVYKMAKPLLPRARSFQVTFCRWVNHGTRTFFSSFFLFLFFRIKIILAC